jgi:CRP-like cAMP-binding protein
MNPLAQPLIRKLENFSPLTAEEKEALNIATLDQRQLGPRQDVIRENESTSGVNLIVEGFACRFKILPDGRRQILGYLVPGDMCDLHVLILKRMDHAIATLTTSIIAVLPRESVLQLTEQFPRLMRALWWATLVDESVTREWVVNVGQRTAIERMAHLFCELFMRLRAVRLVRGNQCDLPVTQVDLADTLALSSVHVNRTLKELRRLGLVTVSGRTLIIHDLDALKTLAMFTPNYLHLEKPAIAPGAAEIATWLTGA